VLHGSPNFVALALASHRITLVLSTLVDGHNWLYRSSQNAPALGSASQKQLIGKHPCKDLQKYCLEQTLPRKTIRFDPI